MKTYTLQPSRWTPEHTVEPCAEADAELLSVHWQQGDARGWLADFHTSNRSTAEDFVAWLRNRQQISTLLDSIPTKGE